MSDFVTILMPNVSGWFVLTLRIIFCYFLFFLSLKITELGLSYAIPIIAARVKNTAPIVTFKIRLFYFEISLSGISIDTYLLSVINDLLHFNCQIAEFRIREIKIKVLPYLHVTISGIRFRGFSKNPNCWSADSVMSALRLSRLDVLDSLTRSILARLTKCKYGYLFQNLQLLPLHCIDIFIAKAFLDIFDTSVGFCARQSGQRSDTMSEVFIEHLQVHPSGPIWVLLFTPMFKMRTVISKISVTSRQFLNEERSVAPPLLYPAVVTGEITLPKVLSQMLRSEPLQSKYCHLDMTASHLTVDFGAVNALGVINFSLAIILYRAWYTSVLESFQKSHDAPTENTREKDTLASYLAFYSSYANEKRYRRRRELLRKCRKLEADMSSKAIAFGRALALGWREDADFYKCFNISYAIDDNDDVVEFDKIVNSIYDQELLNLKEMRFIKVDVVADQVDFRLSTPRTSWNLNRDGKCPPSSAPPATMSLMGIKLSIVDPLVVPSYAYDKVRDIDIKLHRLRFAAGEIRAPTSPSECMRRTIIDRCMVVRPENSLPDSDNDMQEHTLDEKQTAYCDGTTQDESSVILNIHEDPDAEILTVDVVLSHVLVVVDIVNSIEVVEYGLTVVEDMAGAVTFWLSSVDMPIVDEPVLLPSSLFGGKKMRVKAGATDIGFALLDYEMQMHDKPHLNCNATSSLLRIGFDATICITSNVQSEALSGKVHNLQFAPYVQVEKTELLYDAHIDIQDTSEVSHDNNYRGVRAIHLLIRRSQSICLDLLDPFHLDFLYHLNAERRAPPTVFLSEARDTAEPRVECGLPRGDSQLSTGDDVVRSARYYRRRASFVDEHHESECVETEVPVEEENIDQMTLMRYISVISNPLVVSLSEHEAKILLSWINYMIKVVPSVLESLGLNIMRIQRAAQGVNTRTERREYLSFMDRLFFKYNTGENDVIPPQILRELFKLFLEPAQLLSSEIEEQIRDLRVLFDRNFDGRISRAEFTEAGLDLYKKSSWRESGEVPLHLKEYTGVLPRECFTRAFSDGYALNETWRLIESETPLRRGSGTLGALSPVTVQMMLTRLCEDCHIARALWEQIVRVGLRDPMMQLYPWVIGDDQLVVSRLPVGQIVRSMVYGRSATSLIMNQQVYDDHLSRPSSQKRRTVESITRGTVIDMSFTDFNISIGTIQLNYTDSLLGPKMPRLQLNASKIYLQGAVSHQGVVPDLSFTSYYGLVSGIFGGITIDCSFFNSRVGSHEPFVEPYTVEIAAVKLPQDQNIRINVKDQGLLVCNVSAALLQTTAAIVVSLEKPDTIDQDEDLTSSIDRTTDCSSLNEHDTAIGRDLSESLQLMLASEDFSDDDDTNPYLTRMESTVDTPRRQVDPDSSLFQQHFPPPSIKLSRQRSSVISTVASSPVQSVPSFILHNHCGEDLNVSLYASPTRIDRSVQISSVRCSPHHATRIYTPWSAIYKCYPEFTFPYVHFTTLCDMPVYSAKLCPLHSLSLDKVVLTRQSTSSPVEALNVNDILPAIILEHEAQQYDSSSDNLINYTTTLIARSNIQFRNLTGKTLRIKATAASREFGIPLELKVRDLNKKSIPISIVEDPNATLSFYNEKCGEWSTTIRLIDLIHSSSKRCILGCVVLYVGREVLNDSENKKAVCDYSIEVVGGLKFVNSLPYRVEIKYTERINGTTAFPHAPKAHKNNRVRLKCGQEVLLPIGLEVEMASTFNVRVVGVRKKMKRADRKKFSHMWSRSVVLDDMFKPGVRNMTEEEIELPCWFTSSSSCVVRLRKIRDPSKENLSSSKYASTPIIEVYTDLWIQNNSGIPMCYKMKSNTGQIKVVSDAECGPNDFAARTRSQTNHIYENTVQGKQICAEQGPVLGLLDVKHIQMQRDHQQQAIQNVVSLQDFGKVLTQLPIASIAGGQWSSKVQITSTFFNGELVCGNAWLGVSLQSAHGTFSKTKILVLTPRYVIQNMTSLAINIFPVLMWKRIRWSSTEIETQAVREAANERYSAEAHAYRRSENTLPSSNGHDNMDDMGPRNPPPVKSTGEKFQPNRWSSYDSQNKAATDDDAEDLIVLNNDNVDLNDDQECDEDSPSSAATYDDSTSVSPTEILAQLPTDIQDNRVFSIPPHTSLSFFSFSQSSKKFKTVVHSQYSAMSVAVVSNRTHADVQRIKNVLVLTVVSASGLAKADLVGLSDPMCEIVWQGERIHHTRCVRNTLNPTWNEEFLIPISLENVLMSELRMEIYDVDVATRSDFLGQVVLSSDDILECAGGENVEKDLQQQQQDKQSKYVKGKLVFRIRLEHRELNKWSAPLPINNRIVEYITARCDAGVKHLLEVSVKDIDSLMVVVIREHSSSNLPAFQIVNRIPDLHLRLRQQYSDPLIIPRSIIRPASYIYYAWDDPNLPKAVEIVAVDDKGNQSPVVTYNLLTVNSSLPSINVSGLSNRRVELQAQVVVKGHTRVLIISNKENKNAGSKPSSSDYIPSETLCSVISSTEVDVALSGVVVTLIDEEPQELLSLTIDDVTLYSAYNSRSWVLSINHIQLDNMNTDRKFPVVLSPPDSGLNSRLHEDFSDVDKVPIPFFRIVLNPDFDNFSLTKDAFVINHLEVHMQELLIRIDFNFIVRMVTSIVTPNVLRAFGIGYRVLSVIQKDAISKTEDILVHRIIAPGPGFFPTFMIFLKTLKLHSVHIKILLSIAVEQVDIDPHSIGARVKYSTVQNLISLSRGITNINPSFNFNGMVIHNAFDSIDNLAMRVAMVYATQAAMQAFKILGSAEILGDPAGGIANLGTSVRMFVKKTRSEIVGHSSSKGSGLRNLVQGVAGVSFGTAAKMTKSIGEQLASISGSDFKAYMQQDIPEHLGKGIIQGGSVFVHTVANGVVNVGKKPLEGIQAGSVSKTAVGLATGMSGLALAPVIGVLGVTAKFSQGMELTTHIFDEQPIGRRRPARALFHDPRLKPLPNSVVFTEFQLRIRGGDFLFLESMTGELHDRHGMPLYRAVIAVKYGKDTRYSPPFELSRSFRCSKDDVNCCFKFRVNTETGKYKYKLLKVKCILVPSKRSFRFNAGSGGETISKCYFHPLDLVNSRREQITMVPSDESPTSSIEGFSILANIRLRRKSSAKSGSLLDTRSLGVAAPSCQRRLSVEDLCRKHVETDDEGSTSRSDVSLSSIHLGSPDTSALRNEINNRQRNFSPDTSLVYAQHKHARKKPQAKSSNPADDVFSVDLVSKVNQNRDTKTFEQLYRESSSVQRIPQGGDSNSPSGNSTDEWSFSSTPSGSVLCKLYLSGAFLDATSQLAKRASE